MPVAGQKEGNLMKISNVNKCLLGEVSWTEFCQEYQEIKSKVLPMSGGFLTSSDFRIIWDSQPDLVSDQQVDNLVRLFISEKITFDDLRFISSVIMFGGYDFESESVEDFLYSVSNLDLKQNEIVEHYHSKV